MTNTWILIRSYGHDVKSLRPVLESVESQTEAPTGVIVVDADPRCLIDIVELRNALSTKINTEVVSPGQNVGPAGATQIGFKILEERLSDNDFVVIMDDDTPLPSCNYLHVLGKAARGLGIVDKFLGGVGRTGHRFDRSRATLVRPDYPLESEIVPVDYLATNFAPMFRVKAIKAVGFRPELFVGMTEVDFGIRLKDAGFSIYVVKSARKDNGARRTSWRGVTNPVRRPVWRKYYSVRNLINICRRGGRDIVAARVSIRVFGWAIVGLVVRPREAWAELPMVAKGIADGWRGRLGRAVEPPLRVGSIETK